MSKTKKKTTKKKVSKKSTAKKAKPKTNDLKKKRATAKRLKTKGAPENKMGVTKELVGQSIETSFIDETPTLTADTMETFDDDDGQYF